MKAGDRVTTPAGPGSVVGTRTYRQWTGRTEQAIGFVTVKLDHEGVVRAFPAALVKPAEKETAHG